MRYILILLIAIALTIAWQTSVVANTPVPTWPCPDESGEDAPVAAIIDQRGCSEWGGWQVLLLGSPGSVQ